MIWKWNHYSSWTTCEAFNWLTLIEKKQDGFPITNIENDGVEYNLDEQLLLLCNAMECGIFCTSYLSSLIDVCLAETRHLSWLQLDSNE